MFHLLGSWINLSNRWWCRAVLQICSTMLIVGRNITLVELGFSLVCGHHQFPFVFSFSHVDANVDVVVAVGVYSFFFGCVEGFSDFAGQ